MLNRGGRFGIDGRSDWSTDEDVSVGGQARDDSRDCWRVDCSDQRFDDLLFGRERSEANDSSSGIDDVRVAIEFEGVGRRAAVDGESVAIEDPAGTSTCQGQIQLEALGNLQAISTFVLESNISTVGIFDAERIAIVDLVT